MISLQTGSEIELFNILIVACPALIVLAVAGALWLYFTLRRK